MKTILVMAMTTTFNYHWSSFVLQILQEQQALLLEDSPVYLASLSQDNEDSLLNKAADTHDQDLARGMLSAWLPNSDPEAANMYSRFAVPNSMIDQMEGGN